MDAAYETVMDTSDMVWLALAYGLHGVMAAAQAGLAFFLVGSGVRRWRGRGPSGVPDPGQGIAHVALGVLLLLPLLVGAPALVSLGAAAVSLAVLVAWHGGDASVGFLPRAIRVAAIGCAASTLLFGLWEREDGLALGVELVRTMGEVRSEELAWQLAADRDAPKLGDAAPDFELQDPEGVARVRLSDFRGKRPVALVFGSYT